MNKISRAEYNYLHKIIDFLDVENPEKSDLEKLDKEFSVFTQKMKLEEIALLREGEVLLGKFVQLAEVESIKQFQNQINTLVSASVVDNQFNIPVLIVMTGALIKLAISPKTNINDLKGE